jgi:hypothetical protein
MEYGHAFLDRMPSTVAYVVDAVKALPMKDGKVDLARADVKNDSARALLRHAWKLFKQPGAADSDAIIQAMGRVTALEPYAKGYDAWLRANGMPAGVTPCMGFPKATDMSRCEGRRVLIERVLLGRGSAGHLEALILHVWHSTLNQCGSGSVKRKRQARDLLRVHARGAPSADVGATYVVSPEAVLVTAYDSNSSGYLWQRAMSSQPSKSQSC